MTRRFVLLSTLALFLASVAPALAADPVTLWLPSDWKAKTEQADKIAKALSASGVTVTPRVAKNYAEILDALAGKEPALVYAGSFAQAVIKARDLGVPLAQATMGGKELYAGVLVCPKDQDPKAILAEKTGKIAYAKGASSGESSAKAATGGKAAIGVSSHDAACGAVKAGVAEAAVVKDGWWEANKTNYPDFESHVIPGVSEKKNPDNVLTASKAVPADLQKKIAEAAMTSKDAFGAQEMKPFDAKSLDFTLGLMAKGGVDPKTYAW